MINKSSYRSLVLERNVELSGISAYLFLLVAFFSVWVISMGGGLWGQTAAWHQQTQHLLFDFLCHQIPARSFWINGQPMAVCTRCYGIYSGLFGGWLILPWLAQYLKISKPTALVSLLTVGVVNVADVGINSFFLDLHGGVIRCVLGFLLGLSVVMMLISKSNKNKYE